MKTVSYTWVEPFAGAAALALRLVGGANLTPPVAWMGGKRRYARAILDAMGVPAGRPSSVHLCDAGPWGWVWPLLLEPGAARRVAAHLRSWAGEHPRELWDRLAAVPPSSIPHLAAAQWLWLQARSASGVPIWWDGWRLKNAKRGKAQSTWDRYGEDNAGRWRQDDHGKGRAQPANQTGGDERWVSTRPQQSGGVRDARHALDSRGPMGRGGSAPSGSPGWKASDGRGDPRPAGQKGLGWEQGSAKGAPPQPAGQRGTWRMGEEQNKAKRGDRTVSQTGGTWRFDARPCDAQDSRESGQSGAAHTGGMVNPETIAERIEAITNAFSRVDWEAWHGPANELNGYLLEAAPPVFVYLDPPYVGATGYGWDSPRAEVLGLAMAWYQAGAVVCISEAEPIELSGWHHVELTREGGKPEWITLSHEPARLPEQQEVLFA